MSSSKSSACNLLNLCSIIESPKCKRVPPIVILAIGLILNACLYSKLGPASLAIGGGGALIALFLHCACRSTNIKVSDIHPTIELNKTVSDTRNIASIKKLGIRIENTQLILPKGWKYYGKLTKNGMQYKFIDEAEQVLGHLSFKNVEGISRDQLFITFMSGGGKPDESWKENMPYNLE